MSDTANPHDRFFKELLSQPERAADFLRHYLPPEVAAVLDLSAPEPVRDAFVDPDLQQHFADLLYRVRLRQGSDAFVYVLFEHKSAPDRWVAFQLLRYLIRFWERLVVENVKRLPPVYPIVFYHGQRRWRASRNFRSLVSVGADSPLLKHVPEFEYYLVDLSQIADADLQGAPYLRAGLLLFRHIFSRELKRRLPEIFAALSAEPQPSLLEHLRTMLAYLAKARVPLTSEEVKASVTQALAQQQGDDMADFIAEWIQEGFDKGLAVGIEQGREQGLQQGQQQGMRKVVLAHLDRRFGALSEITRQQIEQLSTAHLEQLSEALLDFAGADQLDDWLQQHARTN